MKRLHNTTSQGWSVILSNSLNTNEHEAMDITSEKNQQ